MPKRILNRANHALERHLPEQRLFLRTDTDKGTETRFVRISPVTQLLGLAGGGAVIAWTIVASAILLMDSIGSGTARDQALRKQAVYEQRLDTIGKERDARAAELVAAQARFGVALDQVSAMQTALLDSEERRRELETGIDVIQATLKRTMAERDSARGEAQLAQAALSGNAEARAAARANDLEATLVAMTSALESTSDERDGEIAAAQDAHAQIDRLAYERRLIEERNTQIFDTLEEAITVSMEPLDKVFRSAGLNPDDLLKKVRRGRDNLPVLTPLSASSKGNEDLGIGEDRATELLDGFARLNAYRVAAESVPLAFPLKTSFRYSSPFGRRWGRLHAGVDLAGAYGSPIYATADGTVTRAGWMNGYGNMVEIKHDFGFETVYGHMSKIRVSVGDRVSRGEQVGDMGSTGRSTGTHLHYEVRPGGNAVDPMTYIKAGKDVF
ncbi:M23 family metallopeptidase [Frigidibacter sp. MR17.14]|uniref:M23 family metallopeptidase n=1 Tax=Frigidibacter sp. MR17.14 TaxID=3126509 RepID=UPI0030130082